MPQFSYKAKTISGQVKDGVIQAENKAIVIKRLRLEGLYPVYINEQISHSSKKGFKKVSPRDISLFTRQLANLVHSGFSLARALLALSQQEQNQNLKKLIIDLHEKILKGSTFSGALAAYPVLFSSFYINLVSIGEASGKIDEVLVRLADFKEREDELISQVKSSLTYPVFIFVIGVITVFILITFFIPRFITMFSDIGQVLPLPTQIIIQISKIMNKFWLLFVLLFAAAFIFAKAYYKAEKNRLNLDKAIFSIPLVKNIMQKIEAARFSYALGVLLKSGVPILDSLGVVSFSVDNRFLRKKISSFQADIKKGQSLSSCLEKDKTFPLILVNMVKVGEESGELPEMLLRIAHTFETEVSRNLKTMISLIEPVLILCIGLIVVLIVLSMLLPIFRMDLLLQ